MDPTEQLHPLPFVLNSATPFCFAAQTQRRRFSDVFERYDQNRNGTLEGHELASLIQDLLGPSKVCVHAPHTC